MRKEFRKAVETLCLCKKAENEENAELNERVLSPVALVVSAAGYKRVHSRRLQRCGVATEKLIIFIFSMVSIAWNSTVGVTAAMRHFSAASSHLHSSSSPWSPPSAAGLASGYFMVPRPLIIFLNRPA